MIHLIGCKLELLDVLIGSLSVDDATVGVNNVTLCLMAEHSFDRRDVELGSCLSDDLSDLRVRVSWLQRT